MRKSRFTEAPKPQSMPWQTQQVQEEAQVPRPIPALNVQATVLMLLVGGCVSAHSRDAIEPEVPRFDISEISIDSGFLSELESRSVVLRARIEHTEYGTAALYPKGKVLGASDAGVGIDLVMSDQIKRVVMEDEGQSRSLSGEFIMLGVLPNFTSSLIIDNLNYQPVCQIFSNIIPYPYFILRGIH